MKHGRAGIFHLFPRMVWAWNQSAPRARARRTTAPHRGPEAPPAAAGRCPGEWHKYGTDCLHRNKKEASLGGPEVITPISGSIWYPVGHRIDDVMMSHDSSMAIGAT